MKTCSACRESKPFAAFSKNKAQSDGFANQCKPCFSISNKKTRLKHADKIKVVSATYWSEVYGPKMKIKYAENPEAFKDKSLKLKYGISLEEFDKMRANQNYKCGICSKHESEFKNGLAVDHCHTTLKVRGLLCPKCNTGIGQLLDSVDIITKAASYVAMGGV